jgi:hypothetical protein
VHLHDLGMILRGEHGVQCRSYGFSGGIPGHLAQHVLVHGGN